MNFNDEIKMIKERIKELTSHFPYTKENINYLTIAYMSFIMLDESISDLIDEVLSKTYCLFTTLSINDAYDKYITDNLIDSKCKDSCAIYEGHYYENGEIVYFPYIIISDYQNGIKLKVSDIFDSLIHELKHAINGVINKGNEKGFFNGLSYVNNQNKVIYSDFDEAFNSFLVKIYLDNIAYLKKQSINDKEIKSILENFDIPENYLYSYDSLVIPSLPLFKNRRLFWALYNASLYKNMSLLHEVIEEAFGHGITFKKFMKYYYDRKNYNLDDIIDLIDYSVVEQTANFPKRQ